MLTRRGKSHVANKGWGAISTKLRHHTLLQASLPEKQSLPAVGTSFFVLDDVRGHLSNDTLRLPTRAYGLNASWMMFLRFLYMYYIHSDAVDTRERIGTMPGPFLTPQLA